MIGQINSNDESELYIKNIYKRKALDGCVSFDITIIKQ
jgi:hypothetical protein